MTSSTNLLSLSPQSKLSAVEAWGQNSKDSEGSAEDTSAFGSLLDQAAGAADGAEQRSGDAKSADMARADRALGEAAGRTRSSLRLASIERVDLAAMSAPILQSAQASANSEGTGLEALLQNAFDGDREASATAAPRDDANSTATPASPVEMTLMQLLGLQQTVEVDAAGSPPAARESQRETEALTSTAPPRGEGSAVASGAARAPQAVDALATHRGSEQPAAQGIGAVISAAARSASAANVQVASARAMARQEGEAASDEPAENIDSGSRTANSASATEDGAAVLSHPSQLKAAGAVHGQAKGVMSASRSDDAQTAAQADGIRNALAGAASRTARAAASSAGTTTQSPAIEGAAMEGTAAAKQAASPNLPNEPSAPVRNAEPRGALQSASAMDATGNQLAQMRVTSVRAQSHLAPQGDGAIVSVRDKDAIAAPRAPEVSVAIARSEGVVAPPSSAASVVSQIGDAIASEVQQIVSSRSAPAPGQALTHATAPLVKTLELHLEPRNLGPVTIKMSLSDTSLRIALKVRGTGVAHDIENGRQDLVRALNEAGCNLDELVVQAVGHRAEVFSVTSPSATTSSATGQNNGFSSQFSSQGELGSGGEQSSRGQSQRGGSQSHESQRGDTDKNPREQRSGIYL